VRERGGQGEKERRMQREGEIIKERRARRGGDEEKRA
jgi:hypothetical protein